MNKVKILPSGLQTWLSEHGWRARSVTPITGGYAATLYRLTLMDEFGEIKSAVYKKLAEGRANEAVFYKGALSATPELVPAIYGWVETADEIGILMEDCGVAFKSILRTVPQVERMAWQKRAVAWLADQHSHYEDRLPVMMAAGLPATYPVHSSVEWAQMAFDRLDELADAARPDIALAPADVLRVREMAAWFYPHYPAWLEGRVTLTHGDPHLENLLVADGRFRLIDWEAACVALPQRDLAVLLQDVLRASERTALETTYFDRLRLHGWDVDSQDFADSYAAFFFDNTLMMLGWEIHKFMTGHLSSAEIAAIVEVKLRWLDDAFARLHPSLFHHLR